MTGGTTMAAAPEPARPIGATVEANGPFETLHTGCCIVGGGPGGLVLALLLGRRGVPVILLEAHRDFAREFRGNTLNPATLAIMDELGLADQLLQLRHTKARRFVAHTASGATTFANFERLRTPYRFVAMLPQSAFLARLAVEAGRLPGVRIVMGARAEELIEEGGVV
ncbi:MAG TPA: FAD-dependent monooxygenase, partial [Thermomicrobiales bacterium]